MSEVKAEETPAVVETPKVEGAPALTAAPVTSTTEEVAPAATTDLALAEVKEEKEEAKPAEIKTISEGYLDFKPQGILHFISTRRFFYLQDEPIAADNLTSYLKKEKKEKPEATHAIAAHASQTGKGLLFFAKTDSQKAHPIGIIKLADVVEVTSTVTNKFALKLTSESWNFESLSAADRDSWVHTLKAKVSEAKEGAEAVTSSEGYQQALSKFSKKSGAAKAPEAAKEKEEEKEEKKKEEEEEKAEEKEEKKEEKKKEKEKERKEGAKSDDSSSSSSSESEDEGKGKKVKRSNSKKIKRASFFGIRHKDKKHEKEDKKGKKEEKVEEKKEEEPKSEETKAEAAPAEASTDATAPAVEEEKPAEEPTEEPAKVESPPTEEVTTPKGNKRHSFFGFFDKKAEKKEVEVVKDRDVVSDTPPVIAPIGEEPREATAEETKPVEASTSAAPVESGAKTPSSPPKESFLDKLFKPKEKAASPAPVAPAVAPEVKKDEPAVSETRPEETEAKETEEKAAEASSPKDGKRRTSFFSLGKKKAADVKSDTEDEPSSSKSQPTSPLPKKLNLFRKNSKSAKDAPKAETSEEVPPVPEVTPAVATEIPAPATTEATAPEEETPAAPEITSSTTAPVTTAPATTA